MYVWNFIYKLGEEAVEDDDSDGIVDDTSSADGDNSAPALSSNN